MLNKCVSIDIESSGLLEDMLDYSSFPYKLKEDAKIWVISFTDVATMSTSSLVSDQITKETINEKLAPYDYILQHNGIKFDLLSLQLFGLIDYKIGWLTEEDTLNGRRVRFIDTLILSRLLNPTRFGGHSLKSWGERVGDYKDDYRGKCVEAGIIDVKAPKGEEFKQFNRFMTPYCEQDTIVTAKTFLKLLPEYTSHQGWKMPFKMESKLADLAVRREHLGFWFDKDLALKCVEDLTQKMEELRSKVNPILPPKPMTKTELSSFTPPATQFLKSGKPSTHIIKFAERIGGRIVENDSQEYFIEFENNLFKLPFNKPLKTHTEADISNLDHVKMTLISKGWNPSDWRERDFTKDAKKLSLPYNKRETAFKRWLKETVEDGKYGKHRIEIAFENFKVKTVEGLEELVLEKLKEDFPVRLPTSPNIRVGVEKELCPELVKLGDKVEFAKDFSLYLTYKHRKSSIAGGETEDTDFDEEVPSTGFLSKYRDVDGRVPTPAIEIGANTSRYKHISVANVPRASSEYGKEMRSLFGCGKGAVQLGFDYASLEARIQSHYCWNGTDGKELSKSLLAEKPNDIHTITGQKLGIPRSDAKSVNYMLMYGGSWVKAKKMLNLSDKEAKDIVSKFWESMPALKELKEALEAQWRQNGEKYIIAIDGRKLFVRSKHSIINLCFQSGGVICAKYVTVMMMEKYEKDGYCIDPFKGKPDICSMIEYHDEGQLYCNPEFFKYERFSTEEEAKEFVKNWEGEQLSDISFGKTWYVTYPNVVTKGLEESIKDMEKLLNLNVPLGYAYSVSNNWMGCH